MRVPLIYVYFYVCVRRCPSQLLLCCRACLPSAGWVCGTRRVVDIPSILSPPAERAIFSSKYRFPVALLPAALLLNTWLAFCLQKIHGPIFWLPFWRASPPSVQSAHTCEPAARQTPLQRKCVCGTQRAARRNEWQTPSLGDGQGAGESTASANGACCLKRPHHSNR